MTSSRCRTSPLDDILPTFAHAANRPNVTVLSFLTTQCANLALRANFESQRTFLLETSPGLREVLEVWSQNWRRFFWAPTLGRLREGARRHLPELSCRALVEAGLLAHLDGVSGSWNFRLTSEETICIGRWAFPCTVAGEVKATSDDGIQLRLEDGDGVIGEVQLKPTASANGWAAMRSSSTKPLELTAVPFGSEQEIVLLPHQAIDKELLPSQPGSRFLESCEHSGVMERLQLTANLIQSYAPAYLPWVAGVTRYLGPCESPIQGSGSHPKYPGLIVISNDLRPSALAEMLIHEASHQYFFIASLLGPVDNGSDHDSYYSPLAGRARPIGKLLLAFHALGNIVLFLRKCVDAGINDFGYCERRLAETHDQLEIMQEGLKRTKALTQVGKSLWEPLVERLSI